MIRCRTGLLHHVFYFLPTIEFYKDSVCWIISFYIWSLYFTIEKTPWRVAW